MNEPGTSVDAAADSHATSLSLLERARAREPLAWRRLFDLYGPLVCHWCKRAGLGAEDGWDVAQEVFRAVTVHLGRFHRRQAGDTFRGWLWTITRNKLRDHFRRARHQPEVLGGSDALRFFADRPDPVSELGTDPPDDAASMTEERRVCHRALEMIRAEFEDKTWQAFWQAAVDSRHTADIAAALDMSANAVRKAKSRVLHRLREELGELVA